MARATAAGYRGALSNYLRKYAFAPRYRAEEALSLAVQVGVERAATRLGTTKRTLYRAWDRWGLGRPSDRPLM